MDQCTVYLFASGDSRLAANVTCWPAQETMEAAVVHAVEALGHVVQRAHVFDPDKGHGFLDSQRAGLDAVASIPLDAPVVVAEAVWQYSHHILPGLISHRGPILTVANWSGQWPGLVGMLNLNGSLAKAGVTYSTLWSEDFTDPFFRNGLQSWLERGVLRHPQSHVAEFDTSTVPPRLRDIATEIAADLQHRKAIMGVFDEGCMGMYNAIIPDEALAPLGVFKERLSQSALYAETMKVPDEEGRAVCEWMVARGLKLDLGNDPETELTIDQVLLQCKMYVAAVRMTDSFDCDLIGIQYQQGLKDLLPASDLVEGMLNNCDRPPVKRRDGSVIRPNLPIIHFNEVDECAGLDALLINRVHTAIGQPVETTLHDIRWGDDDGSRWQNDFIWVFEISGAAPPAHHIGGWAGSESKRQPPMYFPSGGGTLSGVARPGSIVWSRIYLEDDELRLDIGLGHSVELPAHETKRRRDATTPEWPIMHATLTGVTRDQLMGRHKSNHVQVVYATDDTAALDALIIRAELAHQMGIKVSVLGLGADFHAS
ncbi:fucose isomerase [Tateyamaria omphalii]|uniref:fucose isomerase n=1 Tax=Tateyamaria omphalii TaxID=299262 RepID=UPI001C994FED|nr:fucose isomerase [Tateyamaria omphalii]MBY5934941.1 fucose isomerase [Tateyamaria omphalii]